MINITDKKQCCGCSACVQACPKNCILLIEDEMGFLYPSVDKETCVNCGLCEKVCPVLNKWEPKETFEISACKNKNEDQRYLSSSGGLFVLLAELVIRKGGVVFGAHFDNDWSVVHSYTETIEGLIEFQGSKYVQSVIGDSYKKTEAFLKDGREVLFSGTPCQVAGLKHYLRKEYDNLLTVEVICHGVPSPKVWRDYLETIRRPKGAVAGKNTVLSSLNEKPSIEGISFRDKQNGWKKYGFVVRYSTDQREAEKFGFSSVDAKKEIREYHQDNLYMKAFLKNLCLRPICFNCAAKDGRSKADISLGDFWTIKQHCPDFDDDKGVTLVYINTEKGKEVFNTIDCTKIILNNGVKYNRMFSESSNEKYPINDFWMKYERKGIDCVREIVNSIQPSLYKRLLGKVKNTKLSSFK